MVSVWSNSGDKRETQCHHVAVVAAGKADGVPLRAEGFPCRPLVRVLRPPFLCSPSQPRFGWLEKTVGLLPGPAPSFPPGRMRPRKAAKTTRPSPQLLSSQRRASLRDGLYFPGFRDPLSFRGSLSCKVPRMRISRQDIGSAVYQSGYAPTSGTKAAGPRKHSRVFVARRVFRWAGRTVPLRATHKSRLACSRHHTFSQELKPGSIQGKPAITHIFLEID